MQSHHAALAHTSGRRSGQTNGRQRTPPRATLGRSPLDEIMNGRTLCRSEDFLFMKLPNAHLATIPNHKLVSYLLSSTHPRGKSKATFFRRLGFEAAAPEALASELARHALQNDVLLQNECEFGVRYVIDGWIVSPAGNQARIRTVWFIDHGREIARFVTAHPVNRRRR